MSNEVHGYELTLNAHGQSIGQLITMLTDALNAIEWGVTSTRRDNLTFRVDGLSQLEMEAVRQRFNQAKRVKAA